MEILIVNNNHTILNYEGKTNLIKLDECLTDKKVNALSTKLCKNKQIRNMMVTALGLGLYCKSTLATVPVGMSTSAVGAKGIDALGWAMMGLVRQWGFWILLIWCMVNLIQSTAHGDQKQALPIILKYTMIYATMFLLPTIFLAIAGAF